MRKKLTLITLLSLLSTAISLHAVYLPSGCWMPESDTIKNYSKGVDGGYILVTAHQKGSSFTSKRLYLRLKGKKVRYKTAYIFVPGKTSVRKDAPEEFDIPGWSTIIFDTPEWLSTIITDYWPFLKNDWSFSTHFTKIYKFPCYPVLTNRGFERWKKKNQKEIQKMVKSLPQ